VQAIIQETYYNNCLSVFFSPGKCAFHVFFRIGCRPGRIKKHMIKSDSFSCSALVCERNQMVEVAYLISAVSTKFDRTLKRCTQRQNWTEMRTELKVRSAAAGLPVQFSSVLLLCRPLYKAESHARNKAAVSNGRCRPLAHLFHELLRPPISHHTVCSVITAHNLTPVQRDGWNASYVCLSHARPTQNTPSITVMKQARFVTIWSVLCLVTLA